MNDKQVKKIRRWCKASFNATPLDQRGDLTLDIYINHVKEKWKTDSQFRVFMEKSMKQHYLL